MTADELRNQFQRQLAEEHGEDWVEEHRAMLDSQWEYVLFMGFVPEDDTDRGPEREESIDERQRSQSVSLLLVSRTSGVSRASHPRLAA